MTGRDRALMKAGCPYCFKFLMFMDRAGLMDQITLEVVEDGSPEYHAAVAELAAKTEQKASFPTVIFRDGTHLVDGDALIDHYADKHGFTREDFPTLDYWEKAMMPSLRDRFFELRRARARLAELDAQPQA